MVNLKRCKRKQSWSRDKGDYDSKENSVSANQDEIL
jgi:hypothetical protein